MSSIFLKKLSAQLHKLHTPLCSLNIPRIPKSSLLSQTDLKSDLSEVNIFDHNSRNDLQLVRKAVHYRKNGLVPKPYTRNLKQVFFYKTIFFAFAIVFIFLEILIATKTAPFSVFLLNYSISKIVFLILTSLLAFVALFLGLIIQSERDAVHQCVQKATLTLKKCYMRKKVQLGIFPLLALFGYKYSAYINLNLMYEESIDAIHKLKEETFLILRHIKENPPHLFGSVTREDLYNQTITELETQVAQIVVAFTRS